MHSDCAADQVTVLDYVPPVDYRTVPHCFDPSHSPVFTVETIQGDLLKSFGHDVVAAVAYTHEARQGYVILCEDGIPVYESLS